MPVKRVVCCGGIAEKNPLLMQIYADVIGLPMQMAASAQACALGSAVAASVLAGTAAGGHESFAAAQKAMTSLHKISYQPDAARHKIYDDLYLLYRQVHDAFGGQSGSPISLSRVMKDLIALKHRNQS